MAFSNGTATKDVVIKRYIGIAPVTVLAVNPNKTALEKLYNINLDKEPEYIGTIERDGKNLSQVRIDFIINTKSTKKDPADNIDYTTKISFFVIKEYRFNRDRSKVQVIDKYGRTAWVTAEQAKTHEIPVYSNGMPANIDKDYRPCYIGEEELTNFIKNYLNIPNVMRLINNTWQQVDNPQDCEARLDNIDKYFTGDFSELNSIIKLQPDNKVKVLFGVKITDDNKQYQTVYERVTVRNNSSNYNKLIKDIEDRKAAGGLANVEFSFDELKEFTIESTNFNAPNVVPDDPFASGNPWNNL